MLQNDKIKKVILDIETPKYDVIAVWHNRANNSTVHKWVTSQLQESLVTLVGV